MTGRRVDDNPNDPNQYPFPKLKPGDYGKGIDGLWYARSPWKYSSGCLGIGDGVKGHKVIEHEDGTITVSPSILITFFAPNGKVEWHGYLERGDWRSA